MNTGIAEILKEVLSDLSFADVVGGMAQIGYITQADFIKKQANTDLKFGELEVIRLPICYEDNIKYSYLTPDKNKLSVMFFEDQGVNIVEQKKDFIDYEGKIRLVCWVNYNKISVSIKRHHIINNIIKVLTDTQANQSPYSKIFVEFIGEDSNDPFTNYDIDIAANQYLMYPYDAFALNFNVLYSVKTSCITDITIKPKIC